MPKIDKLVKQLKYSQTDVSFEDLKKILEFLGYKMRKGGTGSHRIFIKENKEHINIPERKPIKKFYVKKVLEIYDEENEEEL
ncbi:type II toxin-antitoxin system HicA family toxin [Campylobacter ureolyticus]|uniref:type II toxin-antitoxin system HicA family toxin n=1 Tax=Campylobacter ureolyticus TaxID=827 RepID=UPI001FC85F74|nr:type II toxin-antitoxin system HicA family toxin [Campylobacter ureolyticus]MCZ6106044.1 type II toxin-antitoxin system HicA family toxin [Campylobacter ureolyticus]MCZ6158742.1 type II toxin-antitoxin system HicA family toxin [Campylobacter ureolyticus]GKH61385.1 hypothetical protein CE91St25_17210 [Campylobacter ureolyticus]